MIACPNKYIFWLFAIFFIKTVVVDFFTLLFTQHLVETGGIVLLTGVIYSL